MLLTRTAGGSDRDTYAYDALRRLTAAGLTNPYAIILSRRVSEVLILRQVPAEAILPYVPLQGVP